MGSIRLHPKHGVNPFMTNCPRCKGDGRDLILVGADDGIYKCDAPSAEGGPHKMVGRPTPSMHDGDCPSCGRRARWNRVGTLKQGQRIQGTSLCDKCEKEVAEYKAIVEAGGVYIKCIDCGVEGVAKAKSVLAKEAREVMKKPAPELLGAEINKAMGCPHCQELEEKKKEKDHGTGSDGNGPLGVPNPAV